MIEIVNYPDSSAAASGKDYSFSIIEIGHRYRYPRSLIRKSRHTVATQRLNHCVKDVPSQKTDLVLCARRRI